MTEQRIVSGLVTARQFGVDYPFGDEARQIFNYYGRIMYSWWFRKAGVRLLTAAAGVIMHHNLPPCTEDARDHVFDAD